MKSEILQILQMQKDGKLTQDQAAELLAMLADRAREQESSHAANPTTGSGAPGPQAGSNSDGNFSRPGGAAAAFHSFVDTAVGVGATVGRAATVIGGEFINMVHREQAGNSITLSKVDEPTGSDFTFRANSINVSKVAHLSLNHADLSSNSVNASQISHVTITGGRLSQCNISGSSISHITLEGATPEADPANTSAPPAQAILRASTFNATKFARVRLLAGSQIDASTFQAAAVKDLELGEHAELRDSRINESSLTAVRLADCIFRAVTIERSRVHDFKANHAALDQVTFSALLIDDLSLEGGKWTTTRFGRDPHGFGSGGRDSVLKQTRFENCNLSGVEFRGCIFHRTVLRNLSLSGLTIRNIDFTGLTLESEEAFKKAAGLA